MHRPAEMRYLQVGAVPFRPVACVRPRSWHMFAPRQCGSESGRFPRCPGRGECVRSSPQTGSGRKHTDSQSAQPSRAARSGYPHLSRKPAGHRGAGAVGNGATEAGEPATTTTTARNGTDRQPRSHPRRRPPPFARSTRGRGPIRGVVDEVGVPGKFQGSAAGSAGRRGPAARAAGHPSGNRRSGTSGAASGGDPPIRSRRRAASIVAVVGCAWALGSAYVVSYDITARQHRGLASNSGNHSP